MDAYRHITPTERGRIMTLFKQGHSPAAIAAELNRRAKMSRFRLRDDW